MATAPDDRCWLCARPLGARVERHHPVPRSRGGREVRPVHPICHRTLHATFSNKELEKTGDDPAQLAAHPEIARFLAWIARKDPDFHAPTARKRG
jgi:hypothetical protein